MKSIIKKIPSLRATLKKQMPLLVSLFVLLFANTAFAGVSDTSAAQAQTMLKSIESIGHIIGAISAILGVGLVLGGFFRLKLYGQMRGTFMAHQVTIAGPLIKILAGAMMLVLPTAIHTSMLAFWGNANPMHYNPTEVTPFSAYIPVVIGFVRVVGICAFIRGIMLIPSTSGQGKQPGATSKAMLHMLGGLLCINIVQTHMLISALLPV